ncbi:MAG: FAD-dependent oxidoreductase [Rudaea sp.]|uniref:FAD-dependent oxidoreductase n=1 Tax=Rudaea sp. TaxID=2136325 RepID=UPI0039E3F8FC
MARVNSVLVVGGGIGGLTAAIALRQAGIAVDLVEINTDWKVYHIGIVVQANFIRAMAGIGMADRIVAAGFPYGSLVFRDLQGVPVVELEGTRLAGPRYPSHLGMSRPRLHEVLLASVAESGARLRLGATFRSLEQDADGVDVEFTDGSRGRYDVVIGADGIYSKVRETLFGDALKPAYTGQGVWRYNVRRPEELTGSFVTMGLEGGKAGFIPLSEETGYVWLVTTEPGNPWHEQATLAQRMHDHLLPCGGVMARLREQIVDPQQVVYRPLESILLPKPWYRGRILVIGDGAHATTPHLGQGAAQAVEDAVVVAQLLARDEPVEALMAQFMERRYERCKFIAEASLQIGAWEQHPTPDEDAPGLTRKMLEVVAAPI